MQVGVIFPLKPHMFWFEQLDGKLFDPEEQDDPTYGAREEDMLPPPKPKPPPPPYVPPTPNRWTIRFNEFFSHASECNLRNAAFDECGKGVGLIPGAQVCLCHRCPDFTEDQLDRVIVEITGLLIGVLRDPKNKEPCKIISEHQALQRLREAT
jgi:hypothetical protein